jgi:hypothetical protein
MEIQLQQPLVSTSVLPTEFSTLIIKVPVKAIKLNLLQKYQNNKSKVRCVFVQFHRLTDDWRFTNDTISPFPVFISISTSWFSKGILKHPYIMTSELVFDSQFFQNPQQIFHQFYFLQEFHCDGFGF